MRDAHQRPLDRHVSVRYVGADGDYFGVLDAVFNDVDDIEIALDPDIETTLDRLAEADCVLIDTETSTDNALTMLETVRERDPAMPVMFTGLSDLSPLDESLADAGGWDVHPKRRDRSGLRLFERRLRTLVDRARLEQRVVQLRAALDLSQEPTVIVGRNGQITYANHALSAAVTADRESLSGRDWTELFADRSVRHLKVNAIPVAEDGWNWTGTTVLRSPAGDVDTQTSLVKLPDDSTVFVFHDRAEPGGRSL